MDPGSPFVVAFDPLLGTMTSLRHADDPHATDFLMGSGIGAVETRHRKPGGAWRAQASTDPDAALSELPELRVSVRFSLEGDVCLWTIDVENECDSEIELGDLALPMLFNTSYVANAETTYKKRVVRHSFLSGNGSFILVTRPNGDGPHLMITPLEGTGLEYFSRTSGGRGSWEGPFFAYIHALATAGGETRGSWRQPLSSCLLGPAGSAESRRSYGFRLSWAQDYQAAREILYQGGLIDVQIAPGMTVPHDLSVRLALRTQRQELALEAEFPERTKIEFLGVETDTHHYRVEFSELGENRLTLRQGSDWTQYLEFFVTEPLATLIKKRASFIARKQQVRDPGKWFDGLFSLWDMAERTLRTPEDSGGLPDYMVGGSDDPTLCKAVFLAAKNVHIPERTEIEALEYYLKRFVWGGLQRTDQEVPFPYGIYGSDNWHANRNSPAGLGSGGHGQERMWRTFDYTHLIRLYYDMYRIARFYSKLTGYLDARGYLSRAFGTARAFFEVPYSIRMGEPWDFRGWCDWAYKQGNFHERVVPCLIQALEREGESEQAQWLKREWEKKVAYFAYDHPYPFGSEMYFDTTAFESTHAIASYGLQHQIDPTSTTWRDRNSGTWYEHARVSKEDFREFMERQIRANIAARGWLETSYYQLGSDIRQHGNSSYLLSYMTQLGGWAIVDYALNHAAEPAECLRLGYASYLASWALVNSGTEESGYGYWYPGPENDGAAGWGFNPQKYGQSWLGEACRGVHRYDGEIDSGFRGALATACTVVVDDPLFGPLCYGGELSESPDHIEVVPKDGLQQRLHLLTQTPPLRIVLERDAFASGAPVRVRRDASEMVIKVEDRAGEPHIARLTVTGLAPGKYAVMVGGDGRTIEQVVGEGAACFEVKVGEEPVTAVRLGRIQEEKREGIISR